MRLIITTFVAMLAALAIAGTLPAMAEVAPGQEPGAGERIANIVVASMAVAEAKAEAFAAYRETAIKCDFAEEEWGQDLRSLALLIELGELNPQLDLATAQAAIEADIAARRPTAEACEEARTEGAVADAAVQRAERVLREHIAAAQAAEQSILDRLEALESAEQPITEEEFAELMARVEKLETSDNATAAWCEHNATTTLCRARAEAELTATVACIDREIDALETLLQ